MAFFVILLIAWASAERNVEQPGPEMPNCRTRGFFYTNPQDYHFEFEMPHGTFPEHTVAVLLHDSGLEKGKPPELELFWGRRWGVSYEDEKWGLLPQDAASAQNPQPPAAVEGLKIMLRHKDKVDWVVYNPAEDTLRIWEGNQRELYELQGGTYLGDELMKVASKATDPGKVTSAKPLFISQLAEQHPDSVKESSWRDLFLGTARAPPKKLPRSVLRALGVGEAPERQEVLDLKRKVGVDMPRIIFNVLRCHQDFQECKYAEVGDRRVVAPKGRCPDRSYIIDRDKSETSKARYTAEKTRTDENTEVVKLYFAGASEALTWHEVIDLWKHNLIFADFFSDALKQTAEASEGFSYIWQCAPIRLDKIQEHTFNYTTVRTVRFKSNSTAETQPSACSGSNKIVAYKNENATALILSPCPAEGGPGNYGDLAHFVLGAPKTQQRQLWKDLGTYLDLMLHQLKYENNGKTYNVPMWVGTSASDPPWLAVHLSAHPLHELFTDYRRQFDSLYHVSNAAQAF